MRTILIRQPSPLRGEGCRVSIPLSSLLDKKRPRRGGVKRGASSEASLGDGPLRRLPAAIYFDHACAPCSASSLVRLCWFDLFRALIYARQFCVWFYERLTSHLWPLIWFCISASVNPFRKWTIYETISRINTHFRLPIFTGFFVSAKSVICHLKMTFATRFASPAGE